MTAPFRCRFMKCAFVSLLVCFGSLAASAAPSQPSPLFINADPMQPPQVPPQVDAITFWNQSLFLVSNSILLPIPPVLTPYEAKSVVFWTNNGTMVGLPGFKFERLPNPAHMTARERRRRGALLPKPSAVFHNDGEIIAADVLNIHAQQITSPGTLAAGERARIRINATNGLADLSRGAVHVGELPLPFCSSPSNFFLGDPVVRYDYLSSGVDGTVGTNRVPLQLPFLTLSTNFSPNFLPPFPRPPFSEYRQVVGGTNLVTNILFQVESCGQFDAFVYMRTNVFGGLTNRDVSVVFVPTNGLSTNLSVRIGFPTNAFGTLPPIVEFRASYFSVIEQRRTTDILTFRDDGASIFRGHDCELDVSEPPNAPFSPDLFYSTNFFTNQATYFYTVASADVGTTNSIYFTNAVDPFVFFPSLGQPLAFKTPTNLTGTLHIQARDLDLTQARLRAENGVFIQASNLVGNANSFIDAPFITFDAGTTNATLTISNLALPQVNRLQASLNSWAGSWSVPEIIGSQTNFTVTNVSGTNIILTNVTAVTRPVNYQVLILGACIDALHPSILEQLSLRATNIVIQDNLAINRSFQLQGRSVTFGSNSSLSLPAGTHLAFTNLIAISSLTNDGLLNIPEGAYFGAFREGFVQPPPPRRPRRPRRPQPPRLETYENFVNHNLVQASSVSVRAGYLENSGTSLRPAVINGTNGIVSLDGGTLVLSNATVTARGNIQLRAGEALITRTSLHAGSTNGGRFTNEFIPGAIIIDATNSLTDGGLSASNEWFVTSGVRVERRPVPLDEGDSVGDLMGTHIISRAGVFAQAIHVWAGENRGATVAGFENNLALGHLTLDGSIGNDFRFKGAAANDALYVDFLELIRDATNFHVAINVDPNFTIYFGDSNILPEKIEETSGGRIRWVSQFTGPRSSTNIVYPNGVTYTFNSGVVRSRDRDDDGDGIVNAEDCTPISVPDFDSSQPCPVVPLAVKAAATGQNIQLAIALDSGGRRVVLNWEAPANSANTVEFTDSLADAGRAGWLPLTNFVNGPVNARVTVKDAVGGPLRVYRVRVDADKP